MLTLITPAGSPRSVATLAIDCLQSLQIAADRMEKALARFGQGELARAAMKQPDAEVAFQHRDVAADRGRREGQAAGRRLKTRRLRRFGRRTQGWQAFPWPAFNEYLKDNSSHYRLIIGQ